MSTNVMMLSRSVKRVPLDFDWPLNQVWKGYKMGEEFNWPACHRCGPPTAAAQTPIGMALSGPVRYGDGLSVEARAIAEAFYCNGLPEPMRSIMRWRDKLGQAEVDALVAAGRLQQLADGKWQTVPRTAEEVNAANRDGPMLSDLMHDGVNRSILVEFRCKALGIKMTCSDCDGHGDIATAEQRAAADEWEPTEPPDGRGYQLWESVSEGSPVSPVFDSESGLAEWLTLNHKIAGNSFDRADWLRVMTEQVHGVTVRDGQLV